MLCILFVYECNFTINKGRPSADVIRTMLQHVDEFNASNHGDRVWTSVEIEKVQDNLTCLWDVADVVFISKENARHHGCGSMVEAVEKLYTKCRPG